MAGRPDEYLDRKALLLTIGMAILVIAALVLFAVFGNRPDRLL